jgi:hypothetical protein
VRQKGIVAPADDQVILLLAIIAGLVAGSIRAWYAGRHLSPFELRRTWLVLAAFLPQWAAFFLPATRSAVSDDVAAAVLVGSQVLLLVFAWLNREQPGFWLLGLGLACNLLVITLNRGLMPISPEIVTQLKSGAATRTWQVGHRLGTGKDILLPIAAMRLWWLSDRFLTPAWLPYRAAFSVGDVLIAGGAFWFFWALGGHPLRVERKRGVICTQ